MHLSTFSEICVMLLSVEQCCTISNASQNAEEKKKAFSVLFPTGSVLEQELIQASNMTEEESVRKSWHAATSISAWSGGGEEEGGGGVL